MNKKKLKTPKFRNKRLFGGRLKRERGNKAMEYEAAIESLPRITNETVAEHREEVLSSARKYIYPLQHSKHRIVLVSTSLFLVSVVVFFTYTLLALYRFQSTSTFVYRVTQVIPFPVAKTNVGFVSYENYLFTLRHYMHYYETQQRVDFASRTGKLQLKNFKERSLQQAITTAYVKNLAEKNHVTVSESEINRTIDLLKTQNRVGSSDQVFRDVLQEYWGWSISDFKRELRTELIEQKLSAKLDTAASAKAAEVLHRAQSGEDFAALVQQYSDDPISKQRNGEYGFLIKKTNRDISPQVIGALFGLTPGQITDIINTGTALEVDKVLESKDGEIKASHIVIALKPLSTYTAPLEAQHKPTDYIKVQ